MAHVADSVRARVVLEQIPQQGPWDERHAHPAERLGGWGARVGVKFVDILPAMKEASRDRPLYYPVDGHCRPAGHEIIAETLFAVLTRDRLVP